MPSNIIKELNRACIAEIATVEFGFAAIEIPKQNLDVMIHNITFGCLNTDIADRNVFISQYAAILRNTSIDENTTALPLAPLDFPSGTEILWFGNASQVGSVNNVVFPKPFILQGGNNYLIYACVPAYSAVRTATVYVNLSINAEVVTNRNSDNWRLR